MSHYQNIEGPAPTQYGGYMEKTRTSNRKSKLWIIGSVIGIVVLAAIGTVVGVVVSKNNNKSDGSGSSGSGGSTGGPGKNNNTSSDPNDPSNFAKDPNLRQVFYGMAYTPHNALLDFGCANTLEGTIKDIQLISQVTKRVRLYGADCNQTAQVLEAIRQTKVNLEVYLGIYTVPDDRAAYLRQKEAIKDALITYGTDNIGGITVGNEFMLNYVTAFNGTEFDVNSPRGKPGSDLLVADIRETREMLAELNLPKKIPVGNSDAGSFFSTDVLREVDYGLSNVHAWFAQTTAADATKWVFDFFDEVNVKPAALLPNQPKMYVAETGWPTGSKDVEHSTNGQGTADLPSLQTFLDDFVCRANENNIGYFYFEMFDEKWKDDKYGGVEGFWGVFDGDRKLKGITLPNCISP